MGMKLDSKKKITAKTGVKMKPEVVKKPQAKREQGIKGREKTKKPVSSGAVKNLAGIETGMTVKEVAEVLGVSPETVRANGESLYPGLFVTGVTTYLNEEQVTAIKLKIRGHHNLQNTLEVKNAKPRLEKAELPEKTMSIREAAFSLGCNPETIKGHIREIWPGLMRNGKITYLTEAQVTVILEKIKRTTAEHRGAESVNLQRSVASIETSQSMTVKEVEEVTAVKMNLRKNSEAATDQVTLAQIAGITGAAYSTVAAYAQKAGWTENGKQTLLDERQAAIIVEAMKGTGGQGQSKTFQENLEGIETTQSRAVRLAVLAKRQQEIDKQIQAELNAEIAELKAENTRLAAAYGREVLDHNADKALLSERETGLETIQRIAEAGGLLLSDKEDMAMTYRRKRQKEI
jgi:transposase